MYLVFTTYPILHMYAEVREGVFLDGCLPRCLELRSLTGPEAHHFD